MPQVEIMQTDLPHTLFDHSKKKKGGKGGKRELPKPKKGDAAFKLQQEAYERKLAKIQAKAEGKEPFTTDELFR